VPDLAPAGAFRPKLDRTLRLRAIRRLQQQKHTPEPEPPKKAKAKAKAKRR